VALITCPECGRQNVSDKAEACPQCAYPIAKKLAVASAGAPRPGEGAPQDGEAAPQSAPEGERTVWAGTPSQLVNTKAFLGWLLVAAVIIALPILIKNYFSNVPNEVYYGFALAVIPLLILAWKWLAISCYRYEVTTERIKVRTGILSRDHEVVELYRVKDISLERPFIMRMFGLGNVIAITSDKTTPTVTFWAVRRPGELYEELRKFVEQRRVQRRVREMDIE
jgi:membrane protein YdbS with pleckstrin-like domain